MEFEDQARAWTQRYASAKPNVPIYKQPIVTAPGLQLLLPLNCLCLLDWTWCPSRAFGLITIASTTSAVDMLFLTITMAHAETQRSKCWSQRLIVYLFTLRFVRYLLNTIRLNLMFVSCSCQSDLFSANQQLVNSSNQFLCQTETSQA